MTAPQDGLYVKGNLGIGIDPERSLHVRGDMIRLDRDTPNPGILLARWSKDYTQLWKGFGISVEGSGSNNGKFHIADFGTATTGGQAIPRFTINNEGNVGIGTPDPGSYYKLAVEGKIGARGIDVKSGSWADFVFAEDYTLRPLEEVEQFIKEHQHLPEIPSEAEVLEKGVDVGEMLKLQMHKIEELTLYLIQLKKENESLKQTVNALQNKE